MTPPSCVFHPPFPNYRIFSEARDQPIPGSFLQRVREGREKSLGTRLDLTVRFAVSHANSEDSLVAIPLQTVVVNVDDRPCSCCKGWISTDDIKMLIAGNR